MDGGLNTYGYVKQNPVRFIDNNGLVAWEGRAETASFSYYQTKLWARFILTSECVAGTKYKVTVHASSKLELPGNWDLGVSWINANASKISFQDNLTHIDPGVFNGHFHYTSGGFNSPIGGFAVSKVSLGGAHSGWQPSFVIGTADLGLLSANGESELKSAKPIDCDCD